MKGLVTFDMTTYEAGLLCQLAFLSNVFPIGEGWPAGEGMGAGDKWRLTISGVFCVLTACHYPN